MSLIARHEMLSALKTATEADVPDIVALHAAVAERLTAQFGFGRWSTKPTEKAVRFDLRSSKILVLRRRSRLIATLCLTAKRPWAINPAYFSDCDRPVYLRSVAVAPDLQGQGIGRKCIEEAKLVGGRWPADFIRVDAYDVPAGAGTFYTQCGFKEVGHTSYRGCPLVYFECAL